MSRKLTRPSRKFVACMSAPSYSSTGASADAGVFVPLSVLEAAETQLVELRRQLVRLQLELEEMKIRLEELPETAPEAPPALSAGSP